MKSEKGVTLASLIVYIIGMVIIVSIISVLSSYFYKNVKNVGDSIDPYKEYTRFNSFLSEEVNNEGLKILESGDNYIVFSNNIQYEFIKENNAIYRNNSKICSGISNCKFSTQLLNGKDIVNINFEVGDTFKRELKYTLKK